MGNLGIKVIKQGFSTDTTDVRNILLSSQYSMLKYHSDTTVSHTFNQTDTDKYSEVFHNLGYTPAFISYIKYNNELYFLSSMSYWLEYNGYSYSWSNNQKVRVGTHFDYGLGVLPFDIYETNDLYDSVWDIQGDAIIGRSEGEDCIGALRIQNVPIAQGESVSSANLNFIFDEKAVSGLLKIRTRGIDEDNTADFTSDPTSRSQTDAYSDNQGNLESNNSFGINITSQVQEIVNRGGWASGNAMGFLISNNGSENEVWALTYESNLTITLLTSLTLTYRVIIFKDRIAP